LAASLAIVILSFLAVSLVSDGLSAHMMSFEKEPVEGWNHWRWFFLKRSLPGILGTAAILLALAGLILWGWIAFIRALSRE